MHVLIQYLLLPAGIASAQQDALLFLQQSASTHAMQHGRRGDDGILVWRKTQALEPGSFVTAQMKPACDFGSGQKTVGTMETCVMPYKSDFTFAASMGVNGGFKSTDTLYTEVRFEGSADGPRSLTRWMAATPFFGWGHCNLCGGTCRVGGNGSSGLSFASEFPSALGREGQCTAATSELTTPELSFPMLESPPADMNMRATIKWMTDLRNSDGHSRLRQEVGMKVVPSADGPHSEAPASTSNPWATSMFALAGSHNKHGGTGLLGVAIAMLKESIAEVAGLLASPEAQVAAAKHRSEFGWVNALGARITLNSAENPATEIRFAADGQRCETEQFCRFGVEAPVKLAFHLAVDMELKETDYVTIHCEPKVGGMQGRLIAPYIKMPTQKLSLCSRRPRNETLILPLAPAPFNYTPPLCGRYAANASMPAFEMVVPDFRDIRLSDFNVPKIPYVEDRVGGMPSMMWKYHVTLRHADQSVMMDFVAEAGFSQVRS